MAYEIVLQTENERGCGYRKPGKFHLTSNLTGGHCGKVPVALPEKYPCCGAGSQVHRGFQ